MPSGPNLSVEVISASKREFDRWWLVVAGMIFVIVGAGLAWYLTRPATGAEAFREARRAARRGDASAAFEFALHAASDPDYYDRALLLGAESLVEMREFDDAVRLLSDGAFEHSANAITADCLIADILLLRLQQPTGAYEHLQAAIRRFPDSVELRVRLKVLYGLTGQWWQQMPLLLQQPTDVQAQPLDWVVLALARNALLNPEFAQQMLASSPGDPLAQLAAARVAIEDELPDDAVQLLNEAVRQRPDLVQAQVLLGRQYFYRKRFDRMRDWLQQLPASADDHPEIWQLRGRWALQSNQMSAALRCFATAVQLDPNDPESLFQVARLLKQPESKLVLSSGADVENVVAAADQFIQRAERLQQFVNAVKAADASRDPKVIAQAAALADQLGNVIESVAWSVLAGESVRSDLHTPGRPTVGQVNSDRRLSRTVHTHNPARLIDFTGLPEVNTDVTIDQSENSAAVATAASKIRFIDSAANLGINFRYQNGAENLAQGIRKMYEVMGGGIAAFDFDQDNHVDLYFAQGGPWDKVGSVQMPVDQIFRSGPGGRYSDVTDETGIVEQEFSQGVTAGDVNNDGFPDILIANIGSNRLFLNHGDGTFHEDTSFREQSPPAWSTSAAIADLSGDGHPEIFVANYLEGDDLFTRMCGPNRDQVCLPQQFDAATNRVYVNLADGRFDDQTTASGIADAPGKSLGVAVGRFRGQRHLDVFVANDTEPNSFFQNNTGSTQTDSPSHQLKFTEAAMSAGLGLSDEGTVQACMGVAAGDVNNDGQTDLFVTNFQGESNTLYEALGGGVYQDVALRWRLRQPSLSALGFGTQFLDADLNGTADLIVANGHIDNYSDDGRSRYQMQAQFFRNDGLNGFHEVPPRQLGSYFQTPVLGRALARLDLNRDGRPDAVISHLDAPAALLQNETIADGRWLTLQLIGRTSSRDAIGAMVKLECSGRTVHQQLTAGDGFQACNQQLLLFGVADARKVDRLTIEWPSGQNDQFHEVKTNQHWLVREGDRKLLLSP